MRDLSEDVTLLANELPGLLHWDNIEFIRNFDPAKAARGELGKAMRLPPNLTPSLMAAEIEKDAVPGCGR